MFQPVRRPPANGTAVVATDQPLHDAVVVVVVPTGQAANALCFVIRVQADGTIIKVEHPFGATRFLHVLLV